jgi:multidrug resistance efflux pump
MSSAQVHSLEKLLDFQAALATYAHQAKEALCSLDMEIRRTQDWLEGQLKLWQAEVRRAEEEVFQAKQELARRRLMRIGDRKADTTEQEIALAKAQQRLAYAEDKQRACQRWLRELPEAINEYQGYSVNYLGILEGDLPRMDAFLDRKMDVLEAYAQVSLSDGPLPGDKS